ncbi:hypothetical protein PDJAM_G00236500, partial [Pangasius djambal]|nr:hypothetical protein [Pangasius djambal]
MKGRKSRAKRAKHSHTHSHTHTAETPKSTHTGRLNTEICRLCHGRFSARKLRRAFGTQPGPVTWPSSPERSESERSTPRFCSDFQQLLGVSVRRDATLSPY